MEAASPERDGRVMPLHHERTHRTRDRILNTFTNCIVRATTTLRRPRFRSSRRRRVAKQACAIQTRSLRPRVNSACHVPGPRRGPRTVCDVLCGKPRDERYSCRDEDAARGTTIRPSASVHGRCCLHTSKATSCASRPCTSSTTAVLTMSTHWMKRRNATIFEPPHRKRRGRVSRNSRDELQRRRAKKARQRAGGERGRS